jgi:hypothetical protein
MDCSAGKECRCARGVVRAFFRCVARWSLHRPGLAESTPCRGRTGALGVKFTTRIAAKSGSFVTTDERF